ncbi:MAG: endolytic transglycosylase MltG [Spirochaetota bacterium]
MTADTRQSNPPRGRDGAPPRRRPFAARVLAAVVLLVVAGLIVGVGGAYVGAGLLFQPVSQDMGSRSAAFVFEILPNQTLRTVSGRLVAEGLAKNAIAVELYGRVRGLDTKLQAGRYLVSPAMSPAEILQKMASGDAVFNEITITIPEGWSLNDIELHFERLGLFTKERFQQAAVMQPAYHDFELLAHLQDDTILDGYLFPDTYRVFEDSTPESIVRRMLAGFSRRITPEILADMRAQDRTLHDVLTLASIVQEEANDTDQMRDVAGVFWNRLRDGIRLESDATVNYVLGTNKRQPTFADTAVDHPYNTYENAGLPPGPIGNPGIEAILAAIHPAEHDFYFFLHPEDGRIVMSRTFNEHLANKARYLD